jgi:predicted DNA-binding WGR domain protein
MLMLYIQYQGKRENGKINYEGNEVIHHFNDSQQMYKNPPIV